MKPALQLRLHQQLALTPQLQQAIRLLQLSSIELEMELRQALESNPLLELSELDEEGGNGEYAGAEAPAEPPAPPEAPANEDNREEQRREEISDGMDFEFGRTDYGTPASDDPRVALVEDACRDAGLEPRRFRTGGGSDGNVLSAKGVPTLVLASGMNDVHGTNETMRIEDLQGMVRLLTSLLEEACE